MSSISPKIFGQKFPFRNWNFSQISTWLSGSKCSVVTLICFQTCVASSIKPYHQHHFPERYSRVLKLNGKILREPETCWRKLLDKIKVNFVKISSLVHKINLTAGRKYMQSVSILFIQSTTRNGVDRPRNWKHLLSSSDLINEILRWHKVVKKRPDSTD